MFCTGAAALQASVICSAVDARVRIALVVNKVAVSVDCSCVTSLLRCFLPGGVLLSPSFLSGCLLEVYLNNKEHLSYDVRLEAKMEDNQNYSVLFCVQAVYQF